MKFDFEARINDVLDEQGRTWDEVDWKKGKYKTVHHVRSIARYGRPQWNTVQRVAKCLDVPPAALVCPGQAGLRGFYKIDMAKVIRGQAKQQGLALAEVARRLEMNRFTFHGLLRANNPKVSMLPKLAKALGTSLEALVS